MHHLPSLNKSVETRTRHLIEEMQEIFHFYGREESACPVSRLEKKYGKDSVRTCLLRGWIQIPRSYCYFSKQNLLSDDISGLSVCWLTSRGLGLW